MTSYIVCNYSYVIYCLRADDENVYKGISTPQYLLIAWYLIKQKMWLFVVVQFKHRDFTFIIHIIEIK
jgi:hypothetical protein